MEMCSVTNSEVNISQESPLVMHRPSISLFMKCQPFDTLAVAKPLPSHGRKILCQVCGALSSGLHFGVFTCEGCKCFYRRSIREGANYACAKDRGCDITMETRNSCRYCRFQKCLTLGMSKEGIKLGRRPKVECDPLHQVYFRHNDPSIPTMAPTSLPSQQWPHMSSVPTSTVIQIKTELSEDCRAYGSKPLPYRPYIKQEPEESPYPNAYPCHFNGQATGHHSRSRPETNKLMDQWHGQTGITAVWKSETGQAIQINPYFENTNCHQSGAHSQPPIAWTPMQASPDDSGRGSVDPIHWEESRATPAPLNIPDVQTGAIAAMAFANLYRDTTERSRPVESVKRLNDSNNNGEKEAAEDEDEKSYIELMPRNKQGGSITMSTEGIPSQNPFRVASPGTGCAAESMVENFQQMREMLSSDSQETTPTLDKRKLENVRYHSHTFSAKQDMRRKRAYSCHDGVETKKSKLLTDDYWRRSPPPVSQVLWELTSLYLQMESEILHLYDEHKQSLESENENAKSNESPLSKNEFEVSEDFCRQKREQLKKLIQSFIKQLKAKNADWISASINEQIPITFITRICLLRQVSSPISSNPGRHVSSTEISAEEAACLATLSLIYEKNGSADGENANPEKQRLTKNIRDMLKERGFGSQKLQLLLEQQHQTNTLS